MSWIIILLAAGCKSVVDCHDDTTMECLNQKRDTTPSDIENVFDYPSLEEIENQLHTFSSIDVELVNLTAQFDLSSTEESRALWAVKIPAAEANSPTQILIAGLHAREVVPPVVALGVIEGIINSDSITSGWNTWVVPMANPDGYVEVFEGDNMWRKNRHQFQDGIGTDLNRNFPFGWESECGGSTDVNTNKYRGEHPASESETQTLIALMEEQHPGRVLDLHSYGHTVKFGYSCHDHPWADFFEEKAGELTEILDFEEPSSPSAEGELFEWAYASFGGEMFLLELMAEFQPPREDSQPEIDQMIDGIIEIMSLPIAVSGQVFDSATGTPLTANITVEGLTIENEEQMNAGGPYGRFDLSFPDGNWQLTFEKEGYQDAGEMITVQDGVSTSLQIEMVPIEG
jgi:hypothetical protein